LSSHHRVFLLVFFLILALSDAFKCKSDKGKLQIHLVPHTHDDTGWLKTVDEYFYGANRSIQGGAVQYILDTTVQALVANPNRTFIYVEMAFFERWWSQQDDAMQKVVRNLLKERRLEFINGGWCMNDEAASHYNAIIDQMTYGLRFIEKTFGKEARPTVAWQIDPFGHSAEQASLFSQMSFDGLFFGRLDYADKKKRMKDQNMEMIWRGSRNFGKASQLFTGALFNGYSPPDGFCFDDFCVDPPIQDDPKLFDMNVQERVDLFVDETCEQADSYKTNHIVLTMGSDFQYENAHRWYKNLDKLIKYVNEDGRVNVFYSSPSRYLKELNEANKSWQVKTDDFFPYSHCEHCYWTGYFTSRPSMKGYIRQSNNILQACKQLEVIHREFTDYPSSDRLRRAMALTQHHDAVTGTEKQHVSYDYAKRLSMGRDECQDLMSKVIGSKYSRHEMNASQLHFQYCDYLNISVCRITETEKSFVINVYNPIARPVSTYLQIPIDNKDVVVLGSKGEPLKSQIIPLSLSTSRLRINHKGYAAYVIAFEACAPALGFSTYFINQTSEIKGKFKEYAPTNSYVSAVKVENDFIENEKIRLEFSIESGRLVRMIRKDRSLSLSVDQQFFWYNGSVGNDESKQTSGAYIFRPNKTEPNEVCDQNKAKVKIIKGPIVEEVQQTFGNYVTQTIRLYKGSPYAEFEHTVGPIPINDNFGKEIVTHFATNIESAGVFYTDANGREMKERVRNHRDTWAYKVAEPVSGNYYPVNSRISIKDSTSQFTILSDRSQGGSSIHDGEIEIMLHRRLLKDDFLGVGEPLNEPGLDRRGLITRGKHRVLLTTPEEAAQYHREQGELMLLQPIISFAANPFKKDEWMEKFIPIYSGLTKSLPENVHLLTLETVDKNHMIIRLEHFYEKDEDAKLSKPVTIQLKGLFADFQIISVTELNLSANQLLSEKKMWDWKAEKGDAKTDGESGNSGSSSNGNIPVDTLSVVLTPMQIRTFMVEIEYQ